MIKPIGTLFSSLFTLTCLTLPLSAQLQPPLAPLPTPAPTTAPKLSQAQSIYGSIVRIEAATQVPDYREPWKAGRFSGGIGTGFLIAPNKFLTNAHVVSNARRLLITVHGSPR